MGILRILLSLLLICLFIPLYASATEFTAPEVPSQAAEWMPEQTDDFGTGILSMVQKVLPGIRSDFLEALRIGIAVYACVLLVSVLRCAGDGYSPAELAGAVAISYATVRNSKAMILLAAETVEAISQYSKLLLPVLTAASAAQGIFTSATALNLGTSVFTSFLSDIIRQILLPGIWFYLAASIAHCALGEQMLKQLKEQIRKLSVWFLKTILTVFLTYMSITGVITGTVDKAALKAAKAAISTVIPVIGGSLSDASEALLISIGMAKNTVGIYGIFALLAVFLSPFLRIGMHYLILKATAALCSLPDAKRLSDLVNDFAAALGLLLGITGCICVLSLIGTVCFMRGVM